MIHNPRGRPCEKLKVHPHRVPSEMYEVPCIPRSSSNFFASHTCHVHVLAFRTSVATKSASTSALLPTWLLFQTREPAYGGLPSRVRKLRIHLSPSGLRGRRPPWPDWSPLSSTPPVIPSAQRKLAHLPVFAPVRLQEHAYQYIEHIYVLLSRSCEGRQAWPRCKRGVEKQVGDDIGRTALFERPPPLPAASAYCSGS